MLKEGYIEIFVDGIDSFIVNSHGFSYYQLSQMDKQIKEPEEFEEMESFIYCFKVKYSEPQTDHMGRVEACGYWEFEEDKYTKKKNKELKQEFEDFKGGD
jgi:hypothetical protein